MTKLAKGGIGILLLFAVCTLLSTQIYWQHLIEWVFVSSGAVVCITPFVLLISLFVFARRGTLSQQGARLAAVWFALYVGAVVLSVNVLGPHVVWQHLDSLALDGRVYQLERTIFPVHVEGTFAPDTTPMILTIAVYACDGTGLFCSPIGEFESRCVIFTLRWTGSTLQVVDDALRVAWEYTP